MSHDLAGTAGKWLTVGTVVVALVAWCVARPSYADVATASTQAADRVLVVATAALDEHKKADAAVEAARREQAEVLFEMSIASLAVALEGDPSKKRKAAASARAEYKRALTARDATPAKAAAYVQNLLEARE